ncbi:MAG: hypothetical protein EZS28_001513 [Streblomastix strix]|uniref:Uncharacterized protein n=1 Tax=Streblomastix strix TaxID=222440 RepID=A0A5J4X6U5_9EUKA|nr:MAG: hypothetical protein EZS28_001513 [Streblomastix strix]
MMFQSLIIGSCFKQASSYCRKQQDRKHEPIIVQLEVRIELASNPFTHPLNIGSASSADDPTMQIEESPNPTPDDTDIPNMNDRYFYAEQLVGADTTIV